MENINCELASPFFKFGERILSSPQVFRTFNEALVARRNYSNEICSIAPYILEVSEQNEKSYLKYVAPIGRMKFTLVNRELINFLQKLPCTVKRQIGKHCQIPEKLICIAFDVLDNHLVSFGGYFIVESSSLYNLDGSRAKNGVDLTSKDKISTQLGLIGVANKCLTPFEEYFLNQEEDLTALFSHIHPFISQLEATPSGRSSLGTTLKKVEDPIIVDLSDDPEMLSIHPTSSMKQILHLKNRTQITFNEHNMIFGKCRRLLKYVIRPDDEAYKKYRHIGTTELSCRDVSFCPTKFYAEATGAINEPNATHFFRRVFLVGREGRHAIVVPYNNTEDRENFELLAPFTTEVLYQRFEGSEPSPSDTLKKLNPCDVSLDQVHIPLFVPLHDTVTILRYWKTFQSYLSSPSIASPEPFVSELSIRKDDSVKTKIPNHILTIPPQLREIQMELRKKIEQFVCPEFQKSTYRFPANWAKPHSVNQLFCDNLRRNVVQSALRFCRGYVGLSDHLDVPNKIYACNPQRFLLRYVKYFGISELDTFSCIEVGGFNDDPKHEFCKTVNLRNVYNHLMKKHVSSLKFTRAKNSKLLRFRPFMLVPDIVAEKRVEEQDVLQELSALHAHFEEQSRHGFTFFDIVKTARAKKKQSNLEKLKRIPDDATLNTEEVYFVDSTTLNCDPIVEESHEPSDILMPSTFNASAPGTGKDPIDLQNSEAICDDSAELIEDFIPMNQIDRTLASFATDWVRAYVGLTDCLAQIPNCENKFIQNVIILGNYGKYFLVLPFKTDLLSGNMKCSRPFATENVFSRKNRHMPKIRSDEVDLRPPVLDQISVKDLAYILRLRDLVNWASVLVRSRIISRCGIPDDIPP